MAKLPAVRSACAALSILYKDVKGSSPGVRVLCEALESRVGALSTEACSRASPLMDKLENQISLANNVACKSLDWLEASFPIIQSPTDQVTSHLQTSQDNQTKQVNASSCHRLWPRPKPRSMRSGER
uniref:Uncharacterized protein n=1 Tax=Oryzias latipes TaxID=8090 RepID=H2LPC0_ORYLA